jgi:hypothetical protein
MIRWWFMLKQPSTRSTSSNARIQNSHCNRDGTNLAIEKRDLEYNDTIASDYDQCEKPGCLGYVNSQGRPNWQLVRERHEWLQAVKIKLGLNFEAKDLNSRIPTKYRRFLHVFGE